MIGKRPSKSAPAPDGDECLIRTVAKAMRSDPLLRAVQIDLRNGDISAATLGETAPTDFEESLKDTALTFRGRRANQQCGFLVGKRACSECEQPLSPSEIAQLKIEHSSDGVTVSRLTCPTAPIFWRWRALRIPRIVPREIPSYEDESHENEWKPQVAAALSCGILMIAAHFVRDDTISLLMCLAAYVCGGWHAAKEVLERIQRGALDVHFLMLAVAAGSAATGAWAEGGMLLFLFSISGALEHFALGRSQREIRALFRSAPKTATVVSGNGQEIAIPVEELKPGMRLVIKPGELLPVDAEIANGHTAADESNLTGEAVPVEKLVGDTVLAGTLNLWGAATATVLRPATESALQKIIHLIREAQHLKSPSQRFTDRFGTRYTYTILALSLGMFFVWWLILGRSPWISGADEPSAFYRTMTLLVVASPCALVLSIPSAILAAIAWAARRGILFRGGAAIERLAEIDLVALDKTGTLTTGELRIQGVESIPKGHEDEVEQLVFSMERLSTHPLARAITLYGKQKGIAPVDLENFQSIAGLGLQAEVDGHRVRVGRRDWISEGASIEFDSDNSGIHTGVSEVLVAREGLLGRIVLRDEIRRAAQHVVAALRSAGLKTVVLTGDRSSAANRLKDEMLLDDIRSELTPEQKVEIIASYNASGIKAAMVGDGVNDAPSLAAAYVGVAMGARGSDAALEQADIVLMHDRLESFLHALELSRRARRVIRQNLVISMATAAVLAVFALLGVIPLTVGVIGHEGSTVLVVVNSLRLLLGRNAADTAPQHRNGTSKLP